MTDAAELRLAELLASKLCHDLVGPVGAVNNGMELLAEDDLLMGDEAVKLASSSAQQAGTVLQFYRLAYGASGGGVTDYGMVRDLAEKMLRHQKSELAWPEKLPAKRAPLPNSASLAKARSSSSDGVSALRSRRTGRPASSD